MKKQNKTKRWLYNIHMLKDVTIGETWIKNFLIVMMEISEPFNTLHLV